MNQRKLVPILALTLTALLLLAGCGDKTTTGQPSGGSQMDPPSTSDMPSTPESSGDTAVTDSDVGTLIALMGKADADVTAVLGEGSATTDDSGTVTVREYEMQLLEKATITTVAYEGGVVSMIASYAAENEFDVWAKTLAAEWGAPDTETANDADGNASRENAWNRDGVIVSLKESYGALSLEFFREA